jgi:hypothetical protein
MLILTQMITSNLISNVKEMISEYGPMTQHQKISDDTGQMLAQKLNANSQIILLGTMLMDCKIGLAIKENRLPDHIQMSYEAAKEILDKDTDISSEEKENVLHCVLEHHGVNKFYSLESEICCNADCYRFASIQGFFYTLRYFRPMPDEDFYQLLKNKLNEKSQAITLDIVHEELDPQIVILQNFINTLVK